MTTHELFWPRPEQSGTHMATDTQDLPITHPPAVMRSASDSVVNGKGRPAGDVEMCYGHDAENAEPWNCNRRCEDIALHTTAQGTQVVAARELNKSKPVPSTNKARQQLQLPSFHALGIAVPYPTSILTPPDEPATMNSMSPNMGQSQSTPTPKGLVPGEMQASNTPQSPFPPGSILGASNDTPTQAPVGSVISPSIQSGNAPASGSSNSSTATETGSNSSWLDQAIQAICECFSRCKTCGQAIAKSFQYLSYPLATMLRPSSTFSTTRSPARLLRLFQTRRMH